MYTAPVSNPFRVARVTKRLKEIDPSLACIWIPVAVIERDVEENIQRVQGRHALVCYYKDNDPLYQLAIVAGEALPYDLLGWFTTDVTVSTAPAVDCDEMMPVIETWLGKMDNQGHGSLKSRMQKIYEHNLDMQVKREQEFADDVGQHAGEEYRQNIRAASRPGAVPLVQGADFGIKSGEQKNLGHAKRHLNRGN